LALHLVPSACASRLSAVLGSGMVIDPLALLEESRCWKRRLDAPAAGVGCGACGAAGDRLQDRAQETARRCRRGYDRRGIGPAYADKAARNGVQRVVHPARAQFRAGLAVASNKR
jgi:adenylosuccinate synthase